MTHERRRRALRAVANVLVVSGALLVADAVTTLVWQEPVTAVVAGLRQGALEDDLEALREAGPTPLELEALAGVRSDRARIAFLSRSLRRRTEGGDALGRVRIPAAGIDDVVVEGTRPADLRQGPGFYEQVGLPGSGGTTAIAGHRTTYGAPFRRLDDVDRGDEVRVTMPYGTFTYRVEGSRIVPPSAVEVLDRRPYERLVLSACHPLFSAEKRIVVFAKLVRADPGRPSRSGA